ncbi:MAG: 50S ribosomal protein L23 [Patescibacteria group bacterium]
MNLQIIKRPVITEKSLQLANSENVYVFEVDRSATKDQVKEAVEVLYKVNVVDVNTVMRPRVKKATGRKRMQVISAKTKKALVKLQKGQSIKLFDIGGES